MAGEFGEVLRRLRTAAGLTQEELAERSEVSVRTIRGLETGKRTNPRMTTVQQLANALALRPREREELLRAAVPRGQDGEQPAEPEPSAEPEPEPEPEAQPEPEAAPAPKRAKAAAGAAQDAAGVVDPVQWWGALTQQFQQIASSALQEASQLKMPVMPQPLGDPAGAGAAPARSAARPAAAKKTSAPRRGASAPAKRPAPARKRAG